MKKLFTTILLSFLVVGCGSGEGGGSGSASAPNQEVLSALNGSWKLTHLYCYDPTLTNLTVNGNKPQFLEQTLVISGNVVEQHSYTFGCSPVVIIGSINYTYDGLMSMSSLVVKSISGGGHQCSLSYNMPAGFSPSGVSKIYKVGDLVEGFETRPYKLQGTRLLVPLPTKFIPSGQVGDVCFDVYDKN
jgi:hypothetical protein